MAGGGAGDLITMQEEEEHMRPRVNIITLAVGNLEKSLAFYRDGLGLPTKGIVATEYKGSETEPSGVSQSLNCKAV